MQKKLEYRAENILSRSMSSLYIETSQTALMRCCLFKGRFLCWPRSNWSSFGFWHFKKRYGQSVNKNRYKMSCSWNLSLHFLTVNLLKIFFFNLWCTIALSRGRPLFLTEIEWDLILILTSHIKVKKVSSFSRYTYAE